LNIYPTEYPNGHFYSPVVNVEEAHAQQERIFGPRELLSVDLGADRQIELLQSLSHHFGTMPFGDQPRAPLRYYFDNTSYSFGDACIYWAMIAQFRPKRIIEVGCGFTSALALDAIDHFGLSTRCTFIDPYPDLLLKVAAPIGDRHEVIADLVQNVDPALVEQLEPNDFLFIDSSHVVKSGSDVHFELTEMLPRLRPGVIVHFHDTFDKFEYPRAWVIGQNYSWNELYFLHAFLMYNSAFRILYFNDFVGKQHEDRLRQALPKATADRIVINPGGGLWLQRTEFPSPAPSHGQASEERA
jgi:hypothetical protein